jgi:alpha-beta hydrolase superfamily lysophospholipase
LPFLILHGGSDSLTDVEGSKALHETVSSTDKKIIVYDGLYHEIFNEPERMAVLTDVKDWLEGQLENSQDFIATRTCA